MKRTFNSLKKLTRYLGVGLLLMTHLVFGQSNTVSGKVVGDGEELPGVTVQVKGTTVGTITDINGNFTLKASPEDVLTLSFVGFQSKEVVVGNSTNLSITLELDIEQLDEVVVIGYGTQKKKEVTGAVARIDGEDVAKLVTSDLGNALQGKVSGVNVVNSGAPGGAASILIRGVTSVAGDNTPLFVVDGVPQDGDPRLASNEIETIDILKDAASTAIYGARGAAGVILISTKTGKSGQQRVNFDATYGVNTITSTVPTLSTSEEVYFRQNVGKYYGSPTTLDRTGLDNNPEWLTNDFKPMDFLLNDNAPTAQYNLNFSGGQKDFSYNATMGYFNQEGSLINSSFKRWNGRITTRYTKNKLSIRSSISYAREKNQSNTGNLLLQAINYSAYLPFLEPDQLVSLEVNAEGDASERARNFLYQLKRVDTRLRDRFNGSVDVGYELIEGLTIRQILGGGVTNTLDEEFVPPVILENVRTGSTINDPSRAYIQMDDQQFTNWVSTSTITYDKTFGAHKFTGMASFSLEEYTREWFTARKEGVSDPNISVLNGAVLTERAYSGGPFGDQNRVDRVAGIIGRINYAFREKYLLSASVRRDGSSKFGEANRWGTFPGVSVGWNVSEESFWSGLSSFSNSFKVRASYGTIGNQSFSSYSYSAVVVNGSNYAFDASESVGTALRSYPNVDVKWETSIQSNIGVDFGFFNNKLTVTADYYDTQKEDMLFSVRLPPSAGVYQGGANDPGSGVPNVVLNVGNMTNRGVEIAANYRLTKGDLSLDFGAVYSKNKNEITKISGDVERIPNNSGFVTLGDGTSVVSYFSKGYEAGAFFVHQTDGIIDDQEELAAYMDIVTTEVTPNIGDLKYVDTNGDGTINSDDQVYAGSGLPDYELGFNTTITFKGFDLDMQWYASVGNEVINGSAAYAYSRGRHKGLVNMWTPANQETNLPFYRGESQNHPNYKGTTDLWIEDGSFVRMRLLTLGYTLPNPMMKRLNMEKARFYISLQNPITLTNYTGFDPEVGGGSITDKGIDRGTYPISSQTLFGMQLTF